MKHTPGPWRVTDLCDCGYDVVAANGRIVANVTVDEGPDENTMDAEDNANAKLIAAAPQLVEALREEISQLRLWAVESRHGGWSTYQVDPMRRRADALVDVLHAAGVEP